MKAQYMIAFCDILGFSNLVESNPLDTVIDRSYGWFRKALYHSIHKNGFPDDVPQSRALEGDRDIGVALFSDTIFLYTLRNDDEAIRQLITTLGWLIFETMLGGTRIRGGVSYGEAFIDKKTRSLWVPPLLKHTVWNKVNNGLARRLLKLRANESPPMLGQVNMQIGG